MTVFLFAGGTLWENAKTSRLLRGGKILKSVVWRKSTDGNFKINRPQFRQVTKTQLAKKYHITTGAASKKPCSGLSSKFNLSLCVQIVACESVYELLFGYAWVSGLR